MGETNSYFPITESPVGWMKWREKYNKRMAEVKSGDYVRNLRKMEQGTLKEIKKALPEIQAENDNREKASDDQNLEGDNRYRLIDVQPLLTYMHEHDATGGGKRRKSKRKSSKKSKRRKSSKKSKRRKSGKRKSSKRKSKRRR